MHMICAFVFVNATATTEIDTYAHTLSLHDARPISPGEEGGPVRCRRARLRDPALCCSGKSIRPLRTGRPRWRRSPTGAPCRSEEHTSDLQSLMRTSYAVFCSTQQTIHTAHPSALLPLPPHSTPHMIHTHKHN